MDTPQDFSAEPCTPEQVIPDQNLSAAGQDLSAAGHRISGMWVTLDSFADCGSH